MFCEHPTCSLEADTICKYHCYLSICQNHRLEHEKTLLNEVEQQLDDLSYPISILLSRTRDELKQSEESRQCELTRINSLFDRHTCSVDQRIKLSKTSTELIITKREQLILCKTGENQLSKEDYQQMEILSNEVKANLHEQYQLSNQMNNQDRHIDIWPTENDNNVSSEIECIELTDSEDERSRNEIDIRSTDHDISSSPSSSSSSSSTTTNRLINVKDSRKSNIQHVRDYCPLTRFGAFGLDRSHNITRLCPKEKSKQCYLYQHFVRTHHIESSLASQLIKAIRNKCNPMETKIFPRIKTSSIHGQTIQCPFDKTAVKFNQANVIPNTPCSASLVHHGFKNHLRSIHSITESNADLIYHAMKDYGTISHVQFEEDLCDMD